VIADNQPILPDDIRRHPQTRNKSQMLRTSQDQEARDKIQMPNSLLKNRISPSVMDSLDKNSMVSGRGSQSQFNLRQRMNTSNSSSVFYQQKQMAKAAKFTSEVSTKLGSEWKNIYRSLV
jgi:hypothetical protein